MEARKSLGEHPFTVEARVAIQLGRESISSSLVAIGELVKNAYDADAEEVVIHFKGLNTESPSLVITDDGDGMDQETLLSKWMRIGTTHKTALKTTIKERVYTGAKGLGRLGIDRLCSNLNLFTKTEDNSSIYEVAIDWNKYNLIQSVELDSVKHSVFEIPEGNIQGQDFPLPNKRKGSQYVLTGLKDCWDEEFLIDLKKELSLLVSPFSKEIGFRIKIMTDDYVDDFDGYISSEHFLEAAEWMMEASITKDSKINLYIYDSYGKVNHSLENVEWGQWLKGGGSNPRCGPLVFKLYFMRNAKNKNIDTNKFKSKDVKAFLKSNQGVRIYRDHFRVKPYGEPNGEGDWLGLAMRRVINPESITMDNWRIGYNQIVGAVFIGRKDNSSLIDQTNREGLTETPAYFDLRAFSLKCVELFEKHIQSKAKEEKNAKTKVSNFSDVAEKNVVAYKEILDSIEKIEINSNDNETKKQLTKLRASLSEETEKTAFIIEKIDQLEAEKDTLANLASLGILAVSFGHETLASISNAIANSELLKSKITQGMFMLPLDVVDFANNRFSQIERSLNYIKIFGSFSLGNVRRDKRTRRIVDLSEVVKNVLSSFENVLEKKNTKCILNFLDAQIKIRAYEIDWESIFANLITNACWALSDTPAGEREICITLKREGAFCLIEFEDSGCGIEAGVEKHIFNATFTTKRNRKGDAVGTGMGLSIVKTFVEEHSNGTIELVPKGALGGAKFLIRIPAVGE